MVTWSLANSPRALADELIELTTNELTANDLPLHDKFGRAITDLRISITDRCNYKCVYCRTGNEGRALR